MQTHFTIGLAGLALIAGLVLSNDAQAQVKEFLGPYVGLGGGLNGPETSDTHLLDPGSTPGTQTSNRAKFSFDSGYNAIGDVGYKLQDGLRAEIEAGWRKASVKNVNTVPWNGAERVLSVMGNVLYDLDLADATSTGYKIMPYFGAGLGVGSARFENVEPANFPGAEPVTGHDTRFQWQLIGGLTAPLTSHMMFFVEYRYIALDGLRFHSGVNPLVEVINHNDRSHNVLLGVRFFLQRAQTD